VAVVSVGSLLAGDPLWALFAGAVALVALLPSVAHRSAAVMPPWEVILIAALPVLGRLFATTLSPDRSRRISLSLRSRCSCPSTSWRSRPSG
jgi:hypothetical protein